MECSTISRGEALMANIPVAVEKLKDDLVWANYDLAEYKKLFMQSPGTTTLLNSTA